MKSLPHHWRKYLNCPECSSFLILDEGDIRYSESQGTHCKCEVCDSNFALTDVPSYIIRKLQKKLAGLKDHPELDG